MKNTITAFVLSIAIGIFAFGCATVFSGTTQIVNIKVIDSSNNNNLLEDFTGSIREPNGIIHPINGNPACVSVSRGNGPLMIDCRKEGYRHLTKHCLLLMRYT